LQLWILKRVRERLSEPVHVQELIAVSQCVHQTFVRHYLPIAHDEPKEEWFLFFGPQPLNHDRNSLDMNIATPRSKTQVQRPKPMYLGRYCFGL